MRLLERILVATDFGIAAEAVVRMASYVARRFDSRVDLLHVKTPAAGGVRPSSDLDQVLSERLDELARQMVKQGVRNVESVLLDGVEFDQIEQYAQQQDMNLIVMGAAEASSSRQSLPAATAARLRRRASKPVWIVKPGTGPPIRRILCPVDLLPASARALKNAIHFARHIRGRVDRTDGDTVAAERLRRFARSAESCAGVLWASRIVFTGVRRVPARF